MSENTVVHMGENSPEEVALKLVRIIAKAEDVDLHPANTTVDRKWLLDTYAECLFTVRGYRDWNK